MPREQARQMSRVAPALGPVILRFCRDLQRAGQRRFTGPELARWVSQHAPGADGSVTRILRMLRDTGQIGVRCVDRGASLYELTAPAGAANQARRPAKGANFSAPGTKPFSAPVLTTRAGGSAETMLPTKGPSPTAAPPSAVVGEGTATIAGRTIRYEVVERRPCVCGCAEELDRYGVARCFHG